MYHELDQRHNSFCFEFDELRLSFLVTAGITKYIVLLHTGLWGKSHFTRVKVRAELVNKDLEQ